MAYGLLPYGQGPYGGITVQLPETSPPLGGYGGALYGYDPYGNTVYTDIEPSIYGGYGGSAYGHGPYGSIDTLEGSPSITSVRSLDGFHLEVLFSHEMAVDTALLSSASYTILPLFGAAPTTTLSVALGVPGEFGVFSVIVEHSGTTLGGLYEVVVVGPLDIGGTAIADYAPLNRAEILCKGSPPPFAVNPLSSSELLLVFEQPLLIEAVFSPGVLSLDGYVFETTYPQTIIPLSVEHPYLGDASQVLLSIMGQTTVEYTAVVAPTTAITYNGQILPSTDPSFLAQSLGQGTSMASPSGLILGCGIGFTHGWRLGDLSGRLVPNAAYRARLQVDLSSVVVPALQDGTLFFFLISNGAIEVRARFRRVGGQDILTCESGGFFFEIPANFGVPISFEVVRNQKADTYTIVLNGEPLVSELTATLSGPAGVFSGLQFMISPEGVFNIEGARVSLVEITASQTIYSEAWNFLHNQEEAFYGLENGTKKTLLTAKGPLVKDWGDATPATLQDVSVQVNGSFVDLLSVNPYYGELELVIPLPLMPPGIMMVEVFYNWFPTPIMDMAGLNIKGLVLGQADNAPLCGVAHSSGVGLPGGGWMALSRFPMTVVLGPKSLPQPLLRSPRFVGYDKAYTAALSSPATLLLNRDPRPVALVMKQAESSGAVVFYEGSSPPSDEGWTLVGELDDALLGDVINPVPEGVVPESFLSGYYQVLKTTAGPFGIGQVSFYKQDINIAFPETILVVVRVQLLQAQLSPHGVFTGVGFGTHTDNHLYLVGFLAIEGLQHLGMLIEPAYPELVSSWELAFQIQGNAIASSTLTVDNLPSLVSERFLSDRSVRFQILEGSQQGVYTVTSIAEMAQGYLLEVSPPFPANVELWGNKQVSLAFEVPWDGEGRTENPTTYRLVVQSDIKKFPQGRAELYVGGALTGKALDLSGAPLFAIPPDGILLYPTGAPGEVFWGSVDRNAKNLSDWYFIRYAIEPASLLDHFRGLVVAAEMGVVPDQDTNHIWFITQRFGQGNIDQTGERLLIQKWASTQEGLDGLDLSFGYARQEPFFTSQLHCDLDLFFSVEIGGMGAGDFLAIMDDGRREVQLATILYEEGVDRQLLSMPKACLLGLRVPDLQGWTVTGAHPWIVEGDRLQVEKVPGQTFLVANTLMPWPTNSGRFFTVVLEGGSSSQMDSGLVFGGELEFRGVAVRLLQGGILRLESLDSGTAVLDVVAAWDDGARHTFRVTGDAAANGVTLVWDDQVLATVALTDFEVTVTSQRLVWKADKSDPTVSITLWSFSAMDLAPTNALRTLGLYLGGDRDDIRSWELPRIDSLAVSNTSLGALVQPMDWRVPMRVLLHRDPAWGVTLIRPDLPPPPYFDGVFSTQNTQPSAGWINVEYSNLPLSTHGTGWMSFGALDPLSITQQRIRSVRYRIYQYVSEAFKSPHHMVINQQNVITSGEFAKDVTVETGTVLSSSSQVIPLAGLSAHIARVFGFSFINSAGHTVNYLPGSFEFDESTQSILITSEQTLSYYPSLDIPDPEDPYVQNPSLNNSEGFAFPPGDLLNPEFLADEFGYPSNVRVPVTVDYMVGPPLTLPYICSQPLLDGTTLLYEGTPYYTKSLVGSDVGGVEFGSQINDPSDTLNDDPDFILNDPYKFLNFKATPGIAYETISFCETSEGQTCLLTPICDDNVLGAGQAGAAWNEPGDIGNGWIGLALSGMGFMEIEGLFLSDGPEGPFDPVNLIFLEASGGDEDQGGNLQEAILFPGFGPLAPNLPMQGGVFGQLTDLGSGVVTLLYFDKNG